MHDINITYAHSPEFPRCNFIVSSSPIEVINLYPLVCFTSNNSQEPIIAAVFVRRNDLTCHGRHWAISYVAGSYAAAKAWPRAMAAGREVKLRIHMVLLPLGCSSTEWTNCYQEMIWGMQKEHYINDEGTQTMSRFAVGCR